MKTATISFLVFTVFAFMLVSVLSAVEPPPGPPGGEMERPVPPGNNPAFPDDRMGMKAKMNPKEFKEMMKTIMIWKMVKELELTEEECYKLFPKINELDKTTTEMKERVEQLKQNLQDAIKSKKEDEMRKAMEEIEKTESEYTDKIKGIKSSIKMIISIEKQAKLVVFMDEFHKRLKDELRSAMNSAGEKFGQERDKFFRKTGKDSSPQPQPKEPIPHH